MLCLSFDAVIQKVPDQDGAYVIVPVDLRREYGVDRMKVRALFDGAPYEGSVVNMGVKDEKGGVCCIIGLRRDIRAKIGKQAGDTVRVEISQR